MKKSDTIQTIFLLALISAVSVPALACGASDQRIHVGPVLAVDKLAGTFTLLDAETMSPITLAADAALLDQVSNISGSVAVTYENDGGKLRALELK